MQKKGSEKFLISKETGKISTYTGKGDPSEEEIMMESIGPDMEYVPGNAQQEEMKKIKQQFDADAVLPYTQLTGQFSGLTAYKVKKNGKTGLAFGNTMTLLSPVYDSIGYGLTISYDNHYLKKKSSYLFAVKKGNHFGLVNEAGEEILPFQYDIIGPLPGNTTFFQTILNNKKGVFMPYTFYPAIEPRYDYIEYFYGLAVSDKWNFALLKVISSSRFGYVGENGVEYFKN